MDITLESINQNFDYFVAGGKHGFQFIRIDTLAKKIGTSEILLRFLIGILAGYPFSLLYLLLPKHTTKTYKHLFFTVTGLLINYFCFGSDCIYNIFSVFITYISLVLFGDRIQNVIFAFIFHTTYLTIGYIQNASDGYDVKWTTPQCVLCLRLIGLTWNVYDGTQKDEKLTPDQKELSVNYIPSFLEVFGYSYCFCGLLSGLQYSFKLYLRFVEDVLVDQSAKDKTNSRYIECFKRFAGAWIVLLTFAVLDPYYKCDDLLKPSFLEKSFLTKIMQMAFVYYVQYSKYVVVWWFGESISMLVGLSYNGFDETGKVKWDGVSNFKLRVFVFGPFYQDIVDGFNIHTNRWAGRYVFRRLRFVGNKTASHILTLLYLAIWHGFYIGYFVMFLIEFVYVVSERQYCAAWRKVFNVTYKELTIYIQLPLQVLGAFYKFVSCGFAAQAFLLLKWEKIRVVYATCYYWPIFVLGLWSLLIIPTLETIAKERESSLKTTKNKEE